MGFAIKQFLSLLPGGFREVRFGILFGIAIGLFLHFVMSFFFWVYYQPVMLAEGGISSMPLYVGIGVFLLFAVTQCFLSRETKEHLRFTLASPVPRWLVYFSRLLAIWVGLLIVTVVLAAAIAWFMDLTRVSTGMWEFEYWVKELVVTSFIQALVVGGVLAAFSCFPTMFPWLIIGAGTIGEFMTTDFTLFGETYFWTEGWPFWTIGVIGYIIGSFGYRESSSAGAPRWRWVQTMVAFFSRARVFFRFATILFLLGACAWFIWNSDVKQKQTHQTKRFIYSFEPKDRKLIEPMFAKGESIYSDVEKIFNPPEHNGKVQVVLTDVMDQTGVLGIANWKTVRLTRTSLKPELQKYHINGEETLRHELAHVFMELNSEGMLKKFFKHVKVFHEGVATWAESEYPGEELTADQKEKLIKTAVKDSWWEMEFEHVLANQGGRRKEHGGMFPYQHGFVLALALADAFGPDAAAKLAHASKDLERKAMFYKTELFWRTLLSQNDYHYELWRQAYEKRMKKLKEQHEDIVKAMPKPNTKIDWNDDAIWIFQKNRPKNSPETRFCVMIPDLYQAENPESEETKDEDPVSKEMKMYLYSDKFGKVRIDRDRLEKVDKDNISVTAGWAHPKFSRPVTASVIPIRKMDGVVFDQSAKVKKKRFEKLTTSKINKKEKVNYEIINETSESVWLAAWMPESKRLINAGMIKDNGRSKKVLSKGRGCLLITREGEIIDAFIATGKTKQFSVTSIQPKETFDFED